MELSPGDGGSEADVPPEVRQYLAKLWRVYAQAEIDPEVTKHTLRFILLQTFGRVPGENDAGRHTLPPDE